MTETLRADPRRGRAVAQVGLQVAVGDEIVVAAVDDERKTIFVTCGVVWSGRSSSCSSRIKPGAMCATPSAPAEVAWIQHVWHWSCSITSTMNLVVSHAVVWHGGP